MDGSSKFVSNDDCENGRGVEPRQNADNCCACRASWIWIDGSTVTYTNWDAFRPSAYNFAVLRFNSRTFVWDSTTNADKYFVCKRATNHQDSAPATPAVSPEGKKNSDKVFLQIIHWINMFCLKVGISLRVSNISCQHLRWTFTMRDELVGRTELIWSASHDRKNNNYSLKS